MTGRNLINMDNSSSSVVITNRMEATLPLEQTQATFLDPILIAMKGLNGFGGEGKVIKVNSNNNGLTYADDITENITVSLPLLRTDDNIALKGLSTLGVNDANKVIKVNSAGTELEYATDISENITVSLPLLRTDDNIALKGLSTLGVNDANKIIKVNSAGTELEYVANDWTLNNGNLYPNNHATTNVLIGTTTNTNSKKFLVDGTSEFKAQLTIDTSGAELSNGTNTYTLPSSTGTLALTTQIPTNNNQLTNGAGYITSTDVIPALKGGTGKSSLTQNKILQVNFAADGYDFVDLPGGSNWTLNSNNLYPTNYATTTVSINTEAAVPSGYVFQVQGNQFTNGYYRLNGDLETRNGTNGINYATGNIQKVVSNSVAYTYSFPNSTGTFALTESDIKTNNIEAVNDSSNKIVSNSTYGWEFTAGTLSRQISIPDITNYPFIGCDSNHNFEIHIENLGDAYTIVANSATDMIHNFSGYTIKGADESMVFKVDGDRTYFYSEKYSGDATFADSIFAYPSDGSALYFNLTYSDEGYIYYGFATSGTQKAQIGMDGTARITGSWTGSWDGTSDRRLKENIVPIENAIETLMKINVYQFDKYDIDNFDCIHSDKEGELDCLKPFKERLSKDTRFVYGFIAQELWDNTPQIGKMCVQTNDWGEEEPAYIIDDRPILACAVKTIQTQQEQINTLKTELDIYKALMDKLINSKSFADFKKNIA